MLAREARGIPGANSEGKEGMLQGTHGELALPVNMNISYKQKRKLDSAYYMPMIIQGALCMLIHANLSATFEVCTVIISILHVRELRQRAVK